MKRTAALLCIVAISAGSASCTPKPPAVDPVVENIFSGFEQGEGFSEYFDDPSAVEDVFTATYSGLQAEGVDFELRGIEQQENFATATYHVSWDLPRDRQVSYDTTMTLTKANEKWTARWQPRIIHPNLGAHQHLELRAVQADRASVVSSDGVELMRPGLQYRVVVDTSQVRNRSAEAGRISHAIADAGGDAPEIQELADALRGATGNYSVGLYNEQVGVKLAEVFADDPVVRINDEPALVTRDPGFAPELMSRVSSLVSDDTMGANGWAVAVVNNNGAALSNVEYHAPEPSPAVRVSVDYDVQRAAEEAVNLRAQSQVMLVAVRPSTGEILAVAQTPAADRDGDLALQGQFPPGSVFKIITSAAGIDKQGLEQQSIVPCPGTMEFFGRVVTNYNSFSLGSVPLITAFAHSCNTTFADISTRLAPGELAAEGKRFGLGLDFAVPGLTTVTGSIPEGETPLDRTEAGYGQGLDLVTPFGMALVSATVAAGRTPIPQLVSTAKTEVNEQVAPPEPRVIDNLRALMRKTVANGTATGMQAGGTIYGKTGEAEINSGSHAWFTGYRDDDIAFATLVVLGGGSESAVAITDAFFQNLDRFRSEP
ncbi:MAG: penicillin-binding transpeptidase domain-containing protein [Corynebacterium sp.]|nr:penicillin-binding transpeptidase domain-containing protein [Corynebacterium sp.]